MKKFILLAQAFWEYNLTILILFLQELVLFTLTQLIGVFAVLRILEFPEEPRPSLDFTFNEIIFFLVFFTIFVYFLQRFSHRSAIFFKVILGLVIFAGSQMVFSLFSGEFIISTLAAALLSILVLKMKIILLHNIGMIFALAGVGAIIGLSLTPFSVVILLIALSFYDIIAVYKTKHMVKLAEDMVKARAISGIVLAPSLKDWAGSLENVKPGGRFMILGSGDIIMPLILIASVIGFSNLASGLVVLAFSLLGLFLTYYLFITQKTRRPMAALPPIAVMSIIGYLVSIVL
ncbi:MAG: presenilin family intramembrane aspartyl protease [Patescibacteria group bacterium]